VLKTAAALAVGAATGMTTHGYVWERHALRLARIALPVSGLAPVLDGLRIGFITDLHHSEYVSQQDVLRAIDLVQAQRPELIVLGGDYVSYGDPRYVAPVADMLRTLTAPLGVFAILGNHDDEHDMTAALEERGIRVLVDARTTVTTRGAALGLAGIRFWTREAGEIAAVIGGARDPVLLLAHDPRRIYEAAALGVPAVLSGHTHGGQIVLPLVGALAARKFPIAKGQLRRENTELYVSPGVGTVALPIRISCPPEVALVTLQARTIPRVG
jgi:predicted MPP superfamily phosphohydrolase